MADPAPGEPFEYRGLRWKCNQLITTMVWHNELCQIGYDPVSEVYFAGALVTPNWQSACDWAIRTCPGAKCGTCKNYHKCDKCRGICCDEAIFPAERCHVPASGFCHRWESPPCK